MKNKIFKKEILKTQYGITLIALVITIIVLLILAGVSLNLVMGNQGILQQATKAVDKNKAGSIQEEIQLAIAEKTIEYYKNYDETSKTESDYIKEKLSEGITTSSGATITADSEGNLSYTDSNGGTTTGKVDFATGNVTIAGTTTGGTTEKTLANQITSANYGDKINYSVTVDGTTLNNWKVFCKDGSNVYIILDGYLDNTLVPEEAQMTIEKTYDVYWDESGTVDTGAKASSILKDNNVWSNFANGNGGEKAIGSPTLEMFVNSWNQ